jgi:hypothetical protein
VGWALLAGGASHPPVLPLVAAAALGVWAVGSLAGLGFLAAGPRKDARFGIWKLEIHTTVSVYGLLQACAHAGVAMGLVFVLAFVAHFDHTYLFAEEHFRLQFSTGMQKKTSLLLLQTQAAVGISLATVTLALGWVFYQILSRAFHERPSNFIGFILSFLELTCFLQFVLEDSVSRACGSLTEPCILSDTPPLPEASNVYIAVVVSYGCLAVLYICAAKARQSLQTSRAWYFWTVYAAARVLAVAAFVVFQLAFVQAPHPVLQVAAWVAIGVLACAVVLEALLLPSAATSEAKPNAPPRDPPKAPLAAVNMRAGFVLGTSQQPRLFIRKQRGPGAFRTKEEDKTE